MRFNKIGIGLAAGAVVLGTILAAPSASAEEDVKVPDPGAWCYEWAQANSSTQVGVEVRFLGVVGSSANNDAKCKMAYVYSVSERGGGRWFGFNGVTPPGYLPVDWNDACRQQYDGTHVKWVDPMPPPLANIPYANQVANMGYTWQCVK